MNAVVLFSHGSLLCGAGEALSAHAARLRSRGIAPIVEVGYLNYSEPSFAETVDKIVQIGADRIVVTPYFLVPGKFVNVDLPQAITAVQAAHPDVTFVLTEAIGYDERLADALIASAQSAVGPSEWHQDLKRASEYCRANPECPLYGTPDCPNSKAEVGRRKAEAKTDSAFISQPSSLLVMVHGSPRPDANEAMFRVVEVVRRRSAFPIVEIGFLECNAPTIPEAIDSCAAQGAASITAVPYFLHTGAHVAGDLPALLEAGRSRHPEISFRLGDYLGRAERLTDILADRIHSQILQQG